MFLWYNRGVYKTQTPIAIGVSYRNKRNLFKANSSRKIVKMITIPLSKKGKHAGKYETFVSDEDADLASKNWCSLISENKQAVYVRNRETHLLHRIIMERVLGRTLARDEFVDHIDMNGLNNTRENLRLATTSQNHANRGLSKKNQSGYKGVMWHKKQRKWTAKIGYKSKRIWLGTFDTPEEAYAVYCEKAKELYGEFARL